MEEWKCDKCGCTKQCHYAIESNKNFFIYCKRCDNCLKPINNTLSHISREEYEKIFTKKNIPN